MQIHKRRKKILFKTKTTSLGQTAVYGCVQYGILDFFSLMEGNVLLLFEGVHYYTSANDKEIASC